MEAEATNHAQGHLAQFWISSSSFFDFLVRFVRMPWEVFHSRQEGLGLRVRFRHPEPEKGRRVLPQLGYGPPNTLQRLGFRV